MTIFKIASVEQEPEETIINWSVREMLCSYLDERTRHLVGYIERQRAGRVSTAILLFDPEKMYVQTASGRIYHLAGEPGFHHDAEYVWEQWKKANSGSDEINVSNEFYLEKTE